MKYDPEISRKNAYCNEMLEHFLTSNFDKNVPIGNHARSDLNYVIGAFLVGLQREIIPIISRSQKWLDYAIDHNEDFGENIDLHRANLNWARAICEWLENGWDSPGYWEEARVYEEAAWRFQKRPWPRNDIIKYGLDDYMAFAFQAAESDEGFEGYEIAIDMYEHWMGNKPVSLKKTLTPKELAYALCLHYARNEFTKEDLFEAGKKMLKANLEENWFGSGQYIRGATWLKIVYLLDDQALSPLETILKAYDNMPNVPRPDFIGQ